MESLFYSIADDIKNIIIIRLVDEILKNQEQEMDTTFNKIIKYIQNKNKNKKNKWFEFTFIC